MNRESMPTTYLELREYLGGRARRRLCSNTVAVDGGNEISVYLHSNLVAKLSADTTFVTDARWRTETTKDRINRFLPKGYHVFQRDWSWYVSTPGGVEDWGGNYTVNMENCE